MDHKKEDHSAKWKDRVGQIVLVLLGISVIYAVYMLFTAPSGVPDNGFEKVKSDYVLTLLQCLVGVIVMFIPSVIEKKFSVDIPDVMEMLYFVFLFCAIYLGEVRDFYYRVPSWDLILHMFSGAMLGALGFVLVSFFNDSEKVNMQLSPIFVTLFAFCFALAAGTLWEIYEFLADGLLGTNMQKFITADREVLVGRDALADTMEDLIVDALSSLAVCIIGFFTLKKKVNR
ncbi:hypothetical protein ACQKKE_00400 [Desemzia incerta]|uniref:Uncharacterized protein n=1 Tax=Desemzia incerta TaxID=82801 RepID=A0A1I5X9U3_9LACT|nr:hypothetical protein [Desemzia incerta]SFQ28745.1 hypothetical protein SAMN04488506_1296 [Desemzia incerta]